MKWTKDTTADGTTECYYAQTSLYELSVWPINASCSSCAPRNKWRWETRYIPTKEYPHFLAKYGVAQTMKEAKAAAEAAMALEEDTQ